MGRFNDRTSSGLRAVILNIPLQSFTPHLAAAVWARGEIRAMVWPNLLILSGSLRTSNCPSTSRYQPNSRTRPYNDRLDFCGETFLTPISVGAELADCARTIAAKAIRVIPTALAVWHSNRLRPLCSYFQESAFRTKWTAYGRPDEMSNSCPTLGGIRFLKLNLPTNAA